MLQVPECELQTKTSWNPDQRFLCLNLTGTQLQCGDESEPQSSNWSQVLSLHVKLKLSSLTLCLGLCELFWAEWNVICEVVRPSNLWPPAEHLHIALNRNTISHEFNVTWWRRTGCLSVLSAHVTNRRRQLLMLTGCANTRNSTMFLIYKHRVETYKLHESAGQRRTSRTQRHSDRNMKHHTEPERLPEASAGPCVPFWLLIKAW